ncbi:UNVERIFIED_CONTAM: hypothetical protein Sangu_3196400, partial [Sesamum angustifolium]
ALRLDQDAKYLSGEFIDYLKENGILSQWTLLGAPQLNGVAERRNQTLLDMVRLMMSFTELPPSFWGYALETTAKLLNMAPSKMVCQTPYEIWHGKPASYKFVGYPKETTGYYCFDPSEQKILVSRNTVFLEKGFPGIADGMRSTRESRPPERYGFVGLTSQLDNDLRIYGEVMSDIDSNKWLKVMKSEMHSMGSNQVWTLIDPLKGVRLVGCKWVYKRNLGADGEIASLQG